MYKIKASELKHKIEILSLTNSTDEAGSLYENFETGEGYEILHTVFAKVVPVGARDYFEAMSNQMQITHKLVIRYVPGINHKLFIKFKGKKLDIIRVINVDEKDLWLEIQAVEIV